jgi:hypothetical protein
MGETRRLTVPYGTDYSALCHYAPGNPGP